MNSSEIIDKIKGIRAKNNENWMAILKLAFEARPKEARKIFSDITRCDKEINKLSKQLAKGE